VFNPALRLKRRGRLLCSVDLLWMLRLRAATPNVKPKARPKAALERAVL